MFQQQLAWNDSARDIVYSFLTFRWDSPEKSLEHLPDDNSSSQQQYFLLLKQGSKLRGLLQLKLKAVEANVRLNALDRIHIAIINSAILCVIVEGTL